MGILPVSENSLHLDFDQNTHEMTTHVYESSYTLKYIQVCPTDWPACQTDCLCSPTFITTSGYGVSPYPLVNYKSRECLLKHNFYGTTPLRQLNHNTFF